MNLNSLISCYFRNKKIPGRPFLQGIIRVYSWLYDSKVDQTFFIKNALTMKYLPSGRITNMSDQLILQLIYSLNIL